jgi:hypothetical protein
VIGRVINGFADAGLLLRGLYVLSRDAQGKAVGIAQICNHESDGTPADVLVARDQMLDSIVHLPTRERAVFVVWRPSAWFDGSADDNERTLVLRSLREAERS